MMVLGVTSDDKGAQLEALIRTVLEQQGYKRVRSNVVGAGGNELDVEADRESPLVVGVQVTPLMCEAKAYADPVNMPIWQRFLGKLLIERTKDVTTIGTLVALNGINGNVAGSYKDLKVQDSALFVFQGTDLEALATDSGELASEPAAVLSARMQFLKVPQRATTVFYGGAYYWVMWWKYDDEYSIVDARGGMLPTEDVERLRPALEASLPGVLMATEEARVEAQARHDARLLLMGRLLRGIEVSAASDAEHADAVAALVQEPFCQVEDGRLALRAPGELDADAISRLFLSMFEDVVKVTRLSFMIGRHHAQYIYRLVQLLPAIQAGFGLDEAEEATLRSVAPLFPSVWVVLATKIPMITTHRTESVEVLDEAVLASDRNSFWEAVIAAIRSDYSNQRLRGFLYDHMGVAELQEGGKFIVKGKVGPVGQPIDTQFRTGVRQFVDESLGESLAPVYILVRILPNMAEPWEEEHPEPESPLEDV